MWESGGCERRLRPTIYIQDMSTLHVFSAGQSVCLYYALSYHMLREHAAQCGGDACGRSATGSRVQRLATLLLGNMCRLRARRLSRHINSCPCCRKW